MEVGPLYSPFFWIWMLKFQQLMETKETEKMGPLLSRLIKKMKEIEEDKDDDDENKIIVTGRNTMKTLSSPDNAKPLSPHLDYLTSWYKKTSDTMAMRKCILAI